jgi:threonine synthase
MRGPRCGHPGSPDARDRYRGCLECADRGVAVNLVCAAPSVNRLSRALSSDGAGEGPGGIWRYGSALPVPRCSAVTLGEGNTPLVPLPRLAADFGLQELYAKNEAANPTWSHKDRLSSLAVSAALSFGARVITGSSSGNHGASLAAYAARAGMQCVIFTLDTVPGTMTALMRGYGACVVALRSLEERYELMTACVDRFGWYPVTNSVSPPVGSDPYGIDGYKTIAYELFEQLGQCAPDWLIMPVAYGDTLSGALRGFCDLREAGRIDRVPRMAGAEVFPALSQALASNGDFWPRVDLAPTAAFSIAAPVSTYQAVNAIKASGGVASVCTEASLLSMQRRLGSEGLLAEAASCVPLAVTQQLVGEGVISPEESVVCLVTSSGLKDLRSAYADQHPVPAIAPTIDALRHALLSDSHAGGDRTAAREQLLFGDSPPARAAGRTPVTATFTLPSHTG